MNPLATVIAVSWAAGIASFMGGIIAKLEGTAETTDKRELVHGIVAFGGGILVAAVAFALAPEGMTYLPPAGLAAAFCLGGLAFCFFDAYLSKNGGSRSQFIGDAGLVVYPPEQADAAALNLKELKDSGDAWLQERGADCPHIIRAHVGPVMCGHIGTRQDKKFDVFGETVMTAALLKSDGFTVSPQLCDKLSPETRKMLKIWAHRP